MGHDLVIVEFDTIDQSNDVEGSVQNLSEVKEDANRASELRAEGSRDEIICTSSFDFSIGRNG